MSQELKRLQQQLNEQANGLKVVQDIAHSEANSTKLAGLQILKDILENEVKITLTEIQDQVLGNHKS